MDLNTINVVLALVERKPIIGFGEPAYLAPDERWVELGPRIIMEVKVKEVCRSWRSVKTAPVIVKMMPAHLQIEEKIVYLVGYSWIWDLIGTRKTAQQYRQMLINSFEPNGLQEYQTD